MKSVPIQGISNLALPEDAAETKNPARGINCGAGFCFCCRDLDIYDDPFRGSPSREFLYHNGVTAYVCPKKSIPRSFAAGYAVLLLKSQQNGPAGGSICAAEVQRCCVEKIAAHRHILQPDAFQQDQVCSEEDSMYLPGGSDRADRL